MPHKSFYEHSRLPIIRTFKRNRKKFELWGVRVIEGKIIWKMIYFDLAGGSIYREFKLVIIQSHRPLARENIRFSPLFAAGDVSRGGTSATQRQKFHTDDVKPTKRHTKRLLLRVRYANSKGSPSSHAITFSFRRTREWSYCFWQSTAFIKNAAIVKYNNTRRENAYKGTLQVHKYRNKWKWINGKESILLYWFLCS